MGKGQAEEGRVRGHASEAGGEAGRRGALGKEPRTAFPRSPVPQRALLRGRTCLTRDLGQARWGQRGLREGSSQGCAPGRAALGAAWERWG